MVWWKCTVCGHLYEGETPPESCPICGVPAEKFTILEEKPTDPSGQEVAVEKTVDSVKIWICEVCGHLHKGNLPPDSCPICMAKADKFSLQEEQVAEESIASKKDTENIKASVEDTTAVKSWKCSVCGYIHQGSQPPEKCPLCGVPAEKFVEIETAVEQTTTSSTAKTSASPSQATATSTTSASAPISNGEGEEKKWKCAACGYVYKGVTLPDVCPLCGVSKDQFIAAGKENTKSAKTRNVNPQAQSFVARMIQKHHVHPIVVHFPNGILPLAVIFTLLALFGCGESFDTAAYYNMVAVLFSLPIVAYSGYIEWESRYRRARTLLFKIKIASSILMSILLVVLLVWRTFVPNVVLAQDSMSYTYLGISCLMVLFAGITGHIGGKLVFSSRG